MSPAIRLTGAVESALRAGRPVVALESSVLAQGLPAPHNVEAARRMMEAVTAGGAEPAVTAVVQGVPTAGLLPDELARFLAGDGVTKATSRDLSAAMAAGADAATTVAASLTVCRAAGLPVFSTGGIGGVHREPPFDESADLVEMARSPVVVVCSGAKSILDLAATVERLETLGITVLGYRTATFPGFHFADTGLPVSRRVDHPEDVASIYRAQRRIGHPGAVLVVQPPPADAAMDRGTVEAAVSEALAGSRQAGVHGAAVTPWLLSAVARLTGGAAITANLALLDANARLAAAVASCLTRPADS